MSVAAVREYLKQYGLEDRVIETAESSATVELAAKAVGTEPARIAKSMSFLVDGKPIIILLAGDVKTDNSKYKQTFHKKASMIHPEQLPDLVGHPMGGVCPFAVKEGVTVYLDESLKRFDVVYPAAGTGSSAVRLTIPELELSSRSAGWVDVSKPIVPPAE
ncbi:MAG: YbaK/EbsC family protein [Stomatobaculum sp.]|nr:YbaK/EbsC family protein [Stomatobaculum sp.]